MDDTNLIEDKKDVWLRVKIYQKYIVSVVIFILCIMVYFFWHLPPSNFPLGSVVTIDSGESLQGITTMLYQKHIIKSSFFFRTHVILQGGEKRVIAGDYLLDQAVGPADLAYRFIHGQFHLEARKITIPEGWSVFQIGDYLEKNLLNFDKKEFLTLAKPNEGYLFPDTYFVSPTIHSQTFIDMMKKNFMEKIKHINTLSSKHSLKDVIIMASIIEDEARTTESRKIISGILWKRLKLGMPLQVDSTFLYINGKGTFELTADDLKINSPYNTYRYVGLPPGPIGNPGMDAISSALNPTNTNYLYFLSDKNGVMHYAQTFGGHIANRQTYLK